MIVYSIMLKSKRTSQVTDTETA